MFAASVPQQSRISVSPDSPPCSPTLVFSFSPGRRCQNQEALKTYGCEILLLYLHLCTQAGNPPAPDVLWERLWAE